MLKQFNREHFIDITDYSVLAASVNLSSAKPEIISIAEFPTEDQNELRKSLRLHFREKSNFIPANCIIHPPSSFIRKYSLDVPTKARDIAFLTQVLKEEYAIDPDKYTIKVLSPSNGLHFNPELALEKELIFCGALTKELKEQQELIIKFGLFPSSMELGSLSILAGLLNYTSSNRSPTLVLELGFDVSQVAVIFRNQLDLIRPVSFGINSLIPIIQKELTFEDELSAKQLLFSNTFDFTEKGPDFLKKLAKELQSSIDYYEVKTGQSLDTLFVGPVPKALSWVRSVLASSLSLTSMPIDFHQWMSVNEIDINSSVNFSSVDIRWLPLFSNLVSRFISKQGGQS